MKLKLENIENATILMVTDSIESDHIAVLKAGLTKLIQSGKKTILLDFTQSKETDFKDPSLCSKISDLRSWAATLDSQVIVVSAIEKLGHVKTREDAMSVVVSPIAQLQATEAKLQAQLKELEEKKAALTQKLAQAGPEGELKKLQQQNNRLKKQIREAEKIAKRFLSLRTREPFKLPAHEPAREKLENLLESLLKQEGVLK